MFSAKVLLWAVVFLLKKCTSLEQSFLFEDFTLDGNDILSSNLLPSALFTLDSNSRNESSTKVLDGTMPTALSTMNFHRLMFNEYLCNHYLTNKMKMASKFRRRMSEPETIPATLHANHANFFPNHMLDQGSVSYEDWLKNRAILEDVYRHNQNLNKVDIEISTAPGDADPTGYDEIRKDPTFSMKHSHHSYHTKPEIFESRPAYFAHHYPYYPKTSTRKSEKLTVIFEIALTALAFLSFALFLVHLIMSISAIMQQQQQSTTINPRIEALKLNPNVFPSSAETSHILGQSNFQETERQRSFQEIDNKTLNEVANLVLNILDSALKTARNADGECLQKNLCQATQYSRRLSGKKKILLGLLSLGIGWLSEHLTRQTVSKTQSLQAIILGLGMANCGKIYKNCHVI